MGIHKYLIKKDNIIKMFGFIKTVFFTAITFFSSNLLNVNSLECVSLNKQECKERTKITDVNSNEPIFCPFSIKKNNCGGSCNGINDPYAKLLVPDVVKKHKCQSIQFDVKNQ